MTHNQSFAFEKAYALNQQWLAGHQDDVAAQLNLAESSFTSSRFPECEQRIASLLSQPAIRVSDKTSLRAIEIASFLAHGKTSQAPAILDLLIKEVASQPQEFAVDWNFEGTRHFIDQNEKLSSYRTWLDRLFDALASKDRDAILKALQDVKSKFK